MEVRRHWPPCTFALLKFAWKSKGACMITTARSRTTGVAPTGPPLSLGSAVECAPAAASLGVGRCAAVRRFGKAGRRLSGGGAGRGGGGN